MFKLKIRLINVLEVYLMFVHVTIMQLTNVNEKKYLTDFAKFWDSDS